MKRKILIGLQITLLVIVCITFLYEHGYEKHYGSNSIQHYGHTDLTVFWLAGGTILPNSTYEPKWIYKQQKFKPIVKEFHPTGTGEHFLYPPTAALLFAPLGTVPLNTLGKLWATTNAILFIAVYLGTILLILRDKEWYRLRYSILLIAVTFSYPLTSQFSTGQVNIILWALLMGFIGLSVYKHKALQAAGGTLLAIATLGKIFPAMFILPLVIGKKWWALLGGTITSVVFLLLSLSWFSPSVWWKFITERFPAIASGDIALKYASHSIYGTMRQLVHEDFHKVFGTTKEQLIQTVEIIQTMLTIGIGIMLILFTLYVAKKVTDKTRLHYAMMTYSFFITSFILFSKIVLLHYFILMVPVILFLLLNKTLKKNYVFISLIAIAVYLMFYGHLTVLYYNLNKPTTLGANIIFILILVSLNDIRTMLPTSHQRS